MMLVMENKKQQLIRITQLNYIDWETTRINILCTDFASSAWHVIKQFISIHNGKSPLIILDWLNRLQISPFLLKEVPVLQEIQ